MKPFIKSLPKDGECFRYLCSKFPKLSEAKLKERVFTGPDIRKLLSDSLPSETMGDKEKKAWDSFKDVVQNRTPSLTPVPVTRPVTERFDGQDTGILFKKKKNKINKKKEIYTLCTAQAFSLVHY
ncbi:hypothetical protein AVEN_178443-1 [Araneus ventricosus]|uniref:Uncharacterized protein n=1 Tax=Araneus ventricosus TaxID=182803 RepID=A0A4Y2JEV6_ARAVE|nr:hypothetical protein AVEN_178443-1 [Araneus ventricosus]